MLALILADLDDIHWHGGTGLADVVLLLGDIDDNLLCEAAQAYQCKTAFAVRGNHDRSGPFPEGIVNLHLNQVEFGGLRFGGFQGSWKYKPRGHYLYEQSEVADALRLFPAVDIFVAHNSPPVHAKADGIHDGFEAFADYITRHQPRLFLHGHQHVSRETQIGHTRVLGIYGSQLLTL